MVFNATSTKDGLIQFCESTLFGDNAFGQISGNANRLAIFTSFINEALNRVATLIMEADGRWQWDDTNQTDLPIGVTTLVAGQQDYSMSVDFLKITRVEILDANGSWHLLAPIDQVDVYNQSLTDFQKTNGLPMYYDKLGNSLFLYPAPLAASVTTTGGLKVYFQRPPSYFTTSDTTKQPGFNSLFHRLVALIACRNYATDRSMPIAGGIMRGGFKTGLVARVSDEEQSMQDFYALRSKDEKLKLGARFVNYR
jgi:hypothetical protein